MSKPLLIFFFASFFAYVLIGQEAEVVRLKTALVKLKESNAKVDTLNELAFQLYDVNPEEAVIYANSANALAQKLNYKIGIADSFVRLGQVSEVKNDASSAERYYLDAITKRKEIGNTESIAGAYYNLGRLFVRSERFDKAIQAFEQGLRLLKSETTKVVSLLNLKAQFHNSLGDILQKIGEYSAAIEHLEKSIEIRSSLGDEKGLANSYLNAGIFYYQEEIGDTTKSGDYLRKSLALFEKLGDKPNQAMCLLNLGNLFFHQQKSDVAQGYYDRALATGLLNGTDSLRVFRNKGSLLFQQKAFDKALDIYLECLKKFEQTGNNAEIASLYSDIGNTYYENEDYPNTIEYLEKSRVLADSLKLFGVKMLSTTSLAMVQGWEVKQKNLIIKRDRLIGFVILWTILGVAVLLIYSHRKKRQLAEKNAQIAMQEVDELLTEQELKTAYARLEGQEEERKRVALDLHDGIGAMLSTVKLYFSSIDSKLTEIQQENREQYEKATHLLDEACQEVRRISHDMASPILTNLGLEAELKVLAKRIEEAKQLKVKVLTHGLKERLDGNMEVKLYRIIQELVANALKHAKASEISIQLNQFDDVFNLMVEDNGIGFNPEHIKSASNGMGLGNVASRVGDLGGTFEIDSKPGNGTTIMIDIPMNKEHF